MVRHPFGWTAYGWCHVWHRRDSHEETNAYLADSLKGEVERRAGKRACSEAEVIRQAIRDAVGRPAPKPGIIPGDDSWADRADDYLDGFRRPMIIAETSGLLAFQRVGPASRGRGGSGVPSSRL